MNEKLMKMFMEDQMKEIEKVRKMKIKELGYDPGDEFIIIWISKNSQKFRDKWNKQHKE
jgi:hypothetical protein